MSYDVAGHDLLSAEATGLAPEVLSAQGLVAEEMLGLADTDFTGEKAERAARAVALQVNALVAAGPDAGVFSSVGRGSRSVSYKQGGVPLNPAAKKIADRLLDWNRYRSRR